MYVPYLYGRQAELRAIRSSHTLFGSPQDILPLVEPVIANVNELSRCLQQMVAANRACYVIVNPSRGRLNNESAQAGWLADLDLEIAIEDPLRAVYLENAHTGISDIKSFVDDRSGQQLGLVLTSQRLSPVGLASVVSDDTVAFVWPGVDPTLYIPALGAAHVVSISDNFHPLARNADYEGVDWLGNNHLTYGLDGRPGFADFTILPSVLSLTGGPVGAAALHLTYRDAADDAFWVQHFISDETDQNIGTTQTKLLEAIVHLEAQITTTPLRFDPSPAITNYQQQLASGLATNLTTNKSLQIMHHLFAVRSFLDL